MPGATFAEAERQSKGVAYLRSADAVGTFTHWINAAGGREPMSLESFAKFPLLFGPSPIQPLPRLTKHLGGATLWAKREDLNSAYAFGGNKTRKLEYLVADALAQGCDTLVSIGGVQSNHTRQVAAAAAVAGLKCVLVQESWVDWPDVTYDRVGNILLSRLMGADVRLVKAGFGIGFKESWEQALADVVAGGGKPYAIPAGASDHPLGGLGFASWAREVEAQEAELGVFFDTIIVCSVTGSTQAGMIAGFADRPRAGSGGSSASMPPPSPPRRAPRWRGSRGSRRRRSASGATCATTRSSSTTATTPASTASPTRRRSTRCASPPASRR